MCCSKIRTTFTNQSDLDVTEPDELQDQNASHSMTECLIIREEEQGTEVTHVFSLPSELDLIKPSAWTRCRWTPTIIPQNEPLPDCSEDSSPPVTLSEPADVSRLAELSEENLLPTCLDGCCSQPIDAEDYPCSISLSPSPTDASCYPCKQNEDESAVAQNIFQKQIMMTHLTNAAKYFQKITQLAMSQDPSETDAISRPRHSR